MQVREVLEAKPSHVVTTITPAETVQAAIDKLCEQRIGALLVINKEGGPVGIITERDVLTQASRDIQAFGGRLVSDVMTRNLVCALPDDNVDYVMQVMTQNRIRHLPIIEEQKVIGLVSIGDLIKSELEISQVENHMLKDYLHLRGEI